MVDYGYTTTIRHVYQAMYLPAVLCGQPGPPILDLYT
jgi:hypothetical protein